MSTVEKPDGFRVEDRLSHLVAIGAVIATLLAGLVAYMLVQASNDANQAALRADKLGIRAMGELSRAMSDAEADYQAFVIAEVLRTQEGLARQEMEFASKLERHALARQRWHVLAETSMGDLGPNAKDLKFGGVHGPEVDSSFPEHFLAAQTTRAVRYAALQDAHNERASAFGGKVSKYIAIVTMFGVALYLFALLSVSIQHDVRRLFAIVGAALLLVGSLWAVGVRVKEVPPVSAGAAREFAVGHVKLASAHDHSAYGEAIGHFDTAILMRRTFARAYFERATARLLLAASQRSGASVISPDEALETVAHPSVLRRVTRDLEMAHDHGLVSAPVLGRLGHYTSLRGLKLGQAQLIEDGLVYTQEAMETDPAEPTWRFHHALGLLAMKEHEKAMTEYQRGLCLTLFAVVADTEQERQDLADRPCAQTGTERERRSAPQVRLLRAEALSNLELLATSADEDTRAFVRRAAGMLVAPTAARSLTVPVSTAQPAALDVAVQPTAVTLDLADLVRASEARLSVVTSYQPSRRSHIPYVVPELSKALGSQPVDNVRLEFQPDTKPFRCLPDGRYRVDLYAGSVLVGRGVTTANLDDVHQAAVAPDLDLRTCVPDGWRWSRRSLPGLMYGKQTHGRTHGAYLFRFERHPVHGPQPLQQLADFALRLVGEDGVELVDKAPLRGGYLGRLRNATHLTYLIGGAVGDVRVGVDRGDGSAVVVVLKGPPEYVRGRQAGQILGSIGPYYEAAGAR